MLVVSIPKLSRFLAGAVSLVLLLGCQHRSALFYPLGIYAVPSTNDYAIIQQAGFNLITGNADQASLDSAHRHGLRVLAHPGTAAGPRFLPAVAQRAAARFDHHPALWAWYLVDEPDLNRVPPEDVRKAHLLFKAAGAKKPTALVLYQGGEALHYAELADIVMIDRYPIPWMPLANFAQHVRLARLATKRTKPLIAVVQAFDWTVHPKLLPGQSNLRPPRLEELRCMTYSALARRANGLFYYCFNDGAWKILEHPEVWNDLRTVVAEVNRNLPLFKAQHVWWPYVHRFDEPGAGFNAALETSIIPALLQVTDGNNFVPNGHYIVAVNTTEQKLTYRITPPAGAAGSIPVLGEQRSVRVNGPWMQDDFEPFGVHIYGPLALPVSKQKSP